MFLPDIFFLYSQTVSSKPVAMSVMQNGDPDTRWHRSYGKYTEKHSGTSSRSQLEETKIMVLRSVHDKPM